MAHMQIEIETIGYSSKIVMQSRLRMDFTRYESSMIYGLSCMRISPGYFSLLLCVTSFICIVKLSKGNHSWYVKHIMIAWSSLSFSVFLFDTHHQVMIYNRARMMKEVA